MKTYEFTGYSIDAESEDDARERLEELIASEGFRAELDSEKPPRIIVFEAGGVIRGIRSDVPVFLGLLGADDRDAYDGNEEADYDALLAEYESLPHEAM